MEKYAFTWFHGIGLVVLQMVVNTVFSLIGITLTLATLGASIESLSGLFFVIVGFIVLPIVYGILSAKLSEWFGETTFPDELDAKTAALMWIHGLVLVVLMIVVTVVCAVFGLTLSFTVFVTGLADWSAVIFAILGFFVLPLAFGWISQSLTELLY